MLGTSSKRRLTFLWEKNKVGSIGSMTAYEARDQSSNPIRGKFFELTGIEPGLMKDNESVAF